MEVYFNNNAKIVFKPWSDVALTELVINVFYFCQLHGRLDVHMSVHRKYVSKVQPTGCNIFSIYSSL